MFHAFWQNIVSLHGLIDERYPSDGIEAVLQKYLGAETRLSQALSEVLITSYEIETRRPFFFTRRRARAKRGVHFDPRMWEVARSSAAAPTYFEPFQIKSSESLNALDDASDRNIEDLKRRAKANFDDPEKLEKLENLCKVLAEPT